MWSLPGLPSFFLPSHPSSRGSLSSSPAPVLWEAHQPCPKSLTTQTVPLKMFLTAGKVDQCHPLTVPPMTRSLCSATAGVISLPIQAPQESLKCKTVIPHSLRRSNTQKLFTQLLGLWLSQDVILVSFPTPWLGPLGLPDRVPGQAWSPKFSSGTINAILEGGYTFQPLSPHVSWCVWLQGAGLGELCWMQRPWRQCENAGALG